MSKHQRAKDIKELYNKQKHTVTVIKVPTVDEKGKVVKKSP